MTESNDNPQIEFSPLGLQSEEAKAIVKPYIDRIPKSILQRNIAILDYRLEELKKITSLELSDIQEVGIKSLIHSAYIIGFNQSTDLWEHIQKAPKL